MGLIAKLKQFPSEVRSFVSVVQSIAKSGSSWGKLFEIAQEYRLTQGRVDKPYAQISSVYKAIKAIADNVTKADLKYRNRKSREDVDEPTLDELFDQPNPYMSFSDLLQAVTGFYALHGEAFIVKTLSIGQMTGSYKLPAELWTFNPTKFMEIKEKDENGLMRVVAWKYGNQRFELEEIIHIKDWNPDNDFRGLSGIEPIKNQIDIDWQSLIYNKVFFENDASPSMALETEKPMNEQAITRLKEQWRKMHQGASKAHKIAILDSGLKLSTAGSLSHKDMDFIEQKKFMREEILGIWKAPKALFNITEDLNYATFVGQMKIFWIYTLQPILEKIQGAFNRTLIWPYNNMIECYFDISGAPAFQEDFKEKVEIAKGLKDLGYSANEINKRLNLGFEDDPRRDAILVPFNMVRIEDVIDPIEPDPAADPAPTPDDSGKSTKQIAIEKTWRNFVKAHSPREVLFAKTVKSYFWGQRGRLLKEVERMLGEKGLKFEFEFDYDWNYEKDLYKKKILPHIKSTAAGGVSFASALLPSEVSQEKIDALIARIVSDRTEKAVTIVETMRKNVDKAIRDGAQAGSTISEIADAIKANIKNEYNKAATRARVIARTETSSAMNSSSNAYYIEAGVKRKQWITAGDEEVRETHQECGLQGPIGIDEAFVNGLNYPAGDGPAEEVINCRCTLAPVVED